MAKRRRGPDSDDIVADMAEFNTVFVDTSLGTYLAMLVSSSNTISDFRKKMALEHKHCFPTIGEIQVHSVKVERRSNFYHLPDSMLLWSAFHGEVKGNWFLSADVSGAKACHTIQSSELNTSNRVKMGVPNDDGNRRGLSPDVNRIQALPMPLPDAAAEKTIVSGMIAELRSEKSVEKTSDSRPRKKRKMRRTEDECHNRSSEDACALFQASGKDTAKPDIVSCANLIGNSVREESPGGGILPERNGVSFTDATAEVSVVRNDHLEETSPRTTAEKSNLGSDITYRNLLGSDGKNQDNFLEDKMDEELAQDAPPKHSDGVSVKHSDGVGEVNTDGSKSKKKKKKSRKLQDTTDMKQTGKGETMKPCSETLKSDLMEEEKGLSLEQNHGVVMPSNSKASDHLDPVSMLKESSFQQDADAGKGETMKPCSETLKSDLMEEEKDSSLEQNHGVVMPSNSKASDHLDPVSMLKESSFQQDADAVMEPKISTSDNKKRKKKTTRQKKSVDTNLGNSVIEQTANCISNSSGLLLPFTDHIPEETGKGEGITHHEKKGAQMLSDGSTLEDGVTLKKKAEISTQVSSGNGHADIPTVEEKNTISEFNKGDKGSEDTGNKDKKPSKKRKKLKHAASEVQENLPGEDQQVGVDSFATKETSIAVVNSEQEGRQVDLSLVLCSKTEEKSNKIHGVAENAEDLKTNSEKGGEGIDFKKFFLSGQDQDKEDSGDKVRKAIKLQMEASKRVNDNDLAFVSNSTELQNSIKSLENNIAENKSHKRDNTRIKGASAQNSDRDEVISNSLRRSSEEGVKDSSSRFEITLQKTDESLAASSRLNKKNQTLDKPTSVRSEVSHKTQRNKRLQSDLNVANMTPVKTPRKSLFTKSGPIFQENGDESSGDEYGTKHKLGKILAASSLLNRKKQTLDKSTSVKSEILPRKQGNRRLQSGLNVTNMIPLKTPQKKSLFAKSGAIFQENGGESSGDENGAMHSDGDTYSPSDSSSVSGNSVGGSDLSQDSTRNGTNEAEGRSTGRRNMSKLELSASKDLTMDAILRSSKRFKKAKLIASQNEDENNESQAIEVVPESQLS